MMTIERIIERRGGSAGRRLLRIRWGRAIALVLATILAPALAEADRLITTDGKVYEGKIIEKTEAGVTFEVISPGGMRARTFFAAGRVAKLEVGLSPDEKRKKAYDDKKKSMDLSTAEGWYQLGLWCADQQMYDEAADAFQQSIAREKAYLVKGTLAQARMEVGRGRLRTARDLLAALVKAQPDDAAAQAELARVQQRINAELTGFFEKGRAAYQRADYAAALGLFGRVAQEADAALLADLGRTLDQKKEPSLAEMMVTCRLSDALVARPNTFQKVTPLEKPLLLSRLQAMVEAGARASEAAYGAIAAMPNSDASQRGAAAKRELAALERLQALAEVGQRLAQESKEDNAQARFSASARVLVGARARIVLLWVEAVEASAAEALRTLADETVSFGRRLEAADAAFADVREGLTALQRLSAKASDLPGQTRARIVAQRSRFEELERRLRDERDHIKKIETALDRGLRAYERRLYDDAILWLSRLVKEASPREGRSLEDIVKRRTGEDLVDLMVEARIQQARRAKRFREVTRYERETLSRELSRRASQAFVRATDALREARNAAPGSSERRAAARKAINYAEDAIFHLRGRRDIGADLSRRERTRIADDIDDMDEVIRDARALLLSG